MIHTADRCFATTAIAPLGCYQCDELMLLGNDGCGLSGHVQLLIAKSISYTRCNFELGKIIFCLANLYIHICNHLTITIVVIRDTVQCHTELLK